MNPELTIVIPAKNEEASIGNLLASLVVQTYPRIRDTRVFIAVSQDTTDRTAAEALKFSSRLAIKLIPGGLPGAARNAGAALAESEFVLFIDADAELGEPQTLDRAIALARKYDFDCVTAAIYCKGGNVLDRLVYWIGNLAFKLSRLTGVPFASGMFFLMRKSTFDTLGGFPAGVAVAEDYYLSKQVAPRRFAVAPTFARTSNRRFKKFGRFGRTKFLIMSAQMAIAGIVGAESFFFKDRSFYWK